MKLWIECPGNNCGDPVEVEFDDGIFYNDPPEVQVLYQECTCDLETLHDQVLELAKDGYEHLGDD
jgi:hypothetical protein